jgi:PAS domain S-box-containing protein
MSPPWTRVSRSGRVVVMQEVDDASAPRRQADAADRPDVAALVAAAPVILWATDADGRCVYLNRAWRTLTGQTETQSSGFGWFDAVHPDDREPSARIFQDALLRRASFTLEYRLRAADGGFRWAMDAGSPRFAADGAFLGHGGFVTEIETRRSAETAARRNARHVSALLALNDRIRDLREPADISFAAAEILGEALDVSRAGYGTIDPAAETITIERDWNAPGVRSLAGTLRFRDYGSYIEDLKRGDTVVFADAERDPRTATTADALKAISARAVVNMPVTEDSGLVALLYLNHATAREWPPDELDFVRQVAERIRGAVERRRAEQAIAASERRFHAIANSIDQMIWSTRADGFHDYYNDRWYEFTGVPLGSTDGEAWNGMFHPDDQERAWDVWRRSLATGAPYHIQYRLRHHSGRYRWVIGRAQCERDEAGAITRWYGTCTDIHDLKTAEEALRDLNETLEQRVAEAVAEREQIAEALRQAQKMEALGQLTGGVAHDFNNLLQVVVGNLEILQRNLPAEPPRLKRSADNAMTGAKRAATLTQRLLAFSRRQPLAPQPVLADALVMGMADLLTRTLGETIELETVSGAGLWRVEADPNQLESAILNLAVNARDAMPEGGRLTIETSNAHLDQAYAAEHAEVRPGQYVVISVSDTGAGMDKATVARAFEPFFTTKEVGKGTGLGLSMVYGFVKQSGGHVKIYSEPAVGTSVKIYLPRLTGETLQESAEAAEDAPPDGSPSETILVVEDDDDVRMYSVEVLRELGYRVLEAHDGASALRLLERQEGRVDLLFTDVVLSGGMNGQQLSHRARALRPDLKVLFTTGYARNAIVHHGRLDAGVDLITKPFSYADLAARVRDMLDRAE